MSQAVVTVSLRFASAGYFPFTFPWFSLTAHLVPVIEAFGLSGTQAGVVTGMVQLSYIPLSPRLRSRHRPTRVTAIAQYRAVRDWGRLLRGVATTFTAILLPTLLLGVGGTAITFGLPKLVSELFPADRSGTMSSPSSAQPSEAGRCSRSGARSSPRGIPDRRTSQNRWVPNGPRRVKLNRPEEGSDERT